LLKISTIFRAAKTTTGCNMEGYGAGACATAACIAEISNGTPHQVEKAMVLALSPTIAVPCTPRVMIPGLCANHIASAITTGNNAAKIALNSDMEVNVDIDAMISMAAEIHEKAAPIITEINLKWLKPYFNKNSEVDMWVDPEVLQEEKKQIDAVKENSVKNIKRILKNAPAIDCPFGNIVVGGSSMAVGSPTNMGRIINKIIEGEIKDIKIELTTDLFVRRAINVPGILMGAILGAKTDDIKAYKKIIGYVKSKNIRVNLINIKEPEVQRIHIKTDIGSYMLDSRNRGGGRISIVDAIPSKDEAVKAANELGIVVV
ncbi:MAG: L-serine ammonia-lyase, iron-sulfur-dependent, subunit alpha, partial [Actinomycetota bacterium]|nr:L-serine ammonia-lyase, iron-sulfur-dependent, subunit alpha [Actinomycetota bacterium]